MIARCTLAALALLLTGAASASSLDRYRLDRADGWAQALALCDLTRFLLEQRKLDGDVILARDDPSGQFRAFYGPRFLPPNLLYDGDVRRGFFRLERAGQIDRPSVIEARFALDQSMLRDFRRMRPDEVAFLEERSKTCSVLLADIRARHP